MVSIVMLKLSFNRCFHSIMSKSIKHKHNVQSLSLSSFLGKEASLENKEKCLGEFVDRDYSPPFYKPMYDARKEVISPPFFKTKSSCPRNIQRTNVDLDTESIISGVSEIKLIKSLSSSPSWSDDNDTEACRRIQDELEQMDRVLRGIDPIPLHYDVDEYKQWMETFPNLSLFGHKEYGPYRIWKNEHELKEKNTTPNRMPFPNLTKYKNEMKKAVIQNIYENISIRLNNGSTPPSSSEIKKRQPQIGDINKTQIYLNDCLKNSPFSDIAREKYTKTCFLSRNNSEEGKRIQSPSFESLPIVIEGPKSAKPIHKYKNEGLSYVSRKKSRRSVVLPPIENKWVQDANQFRSISATPRYSLLAGRTIKMDGKLLSGRFRKLPN